MLYFAALDEKIKPMMIRRQDGLYGCSKCNYVTKYGTTCQNHIESKHMSTSGFICPHCEKFCPTRNAMKSHITKNHRNFDNQY